MSSPGNAEIAELEAVLDGVPEAYHKHDSPELYEAVFAWIERLPPERYASLRLGLRQWLAGQRSWYVGLALDIAVRFRDDQLMNAAVCHARERFESEASIEDRIAASRDPAYTALNGALSGALSHFPTAAGIAYQRELAAGLDQATRPEERALRARAAVVLCFVEDRPLQCLEPILATVRGWNEPEQSHRVIRYLALLFAKRRGERAAVKAMLRPEERKFALAYIR